MNRILGATAVIVTSLGLAACDLAQPAAEQSSAPAVIHSAHGLETATGAFHGASGHTTQGTASVFRVDGEWVVSLGSDFSFDGAPDPHVALGHDGYRADATLGKLTSNNGAQVYAIPANLDVADFNEVWIWCEQFSVPLGSAKLKLL